MPYHEIKQLLLTDMIAEADKALFLKYYPLFYRKRESIWKDPVQGASPLSFTPQKAGRKPICLGHFLRLVQEAEQKAGCRPIHPSWFLEGWGELNTFLFRTYRFRIPSSRFSPPQHDKSDLEAWNISGIPFELGLPLQMVVEELKTGRPVMSYRLLKNYFHLHESAAANPDIVSLEITEQYPEEVRVKLVLKNQKIRIPNDPGPINFTWRRYDDRLQNFLRSFIDQAAAVFKDELTGNPWLVKSYPLADLLQERNPIAGEIQRMQELYTTGMEEINKDFRHP